MSWTKDRVKLLKRLMADGLSFSKIAVHLGGVSRNAVIGKAHRLNLHRPKPNKTYAKKPNRIPKPKHPWAPRRESVSATLLKPEPYKPDAVFETPAAERKDLIDLDAQDCKFPFGDGPFVFCGRPQAPGLPYCIDHARTCYVPPRPNSREPVAPPVFKIVKETA